MRALIWIIVAGLIALFFAGDKLRGYLGGRPGDVAELNASPRASDEARARTTDGERRPASGAYAPSPADAPELYESPTRRLGF